MFSSVDLPFDEDYWLELEIDTEILDPRQKMTMVGYSAVSDTADYAQRVATVDGATGGTISGNVSIQSDLSVDGNIDATGKATIGPGHTNTGYHAFAAGDNNTASGSYSSVSGGIFNNAGGNNSSIGGGFANAAFGHLSSIAGGYFDTVNAMYGGIASGFSNMAGDAAGDTGAFVGGGYDNSALAPYSFIGSGRSNSALDTAAVVCGGMNNEAVGYLSSVGGGFTNIAGGAASTVGGGSNNTASGLASVIAGGYAGTASDENATIGGGWHNVASGVVSTVAGGQEDTASGIYSTVGGGYGNVASGNYSTIPGGSNNMASGSFSMAAGLQAKANHSGSFVWNDFSGGNFASTGDNQFLIRASGGVGIGTNSPTAALHVNGEAKSEVGGVTFYMVPQGAIIMWSGTLASIPSGWALCDGSNGTPNLSDRFIYSVHAGENPGGIGGNAEIPAHSHSVTHDHPVTATGNNSHSQTVLELGGWQVARNPHTHNLDLPPITVNTNIQPATSIIPPYYKLAFIMKL